MKVYGILGTAFVTGAFILALAGARSGHSVDDADIPTATVNVKDEVPTVPRSELVTADCRLEVSTDKAEYQPGDSPILTLTAKNVANRSFETNVHLQIMATEIPSPLSRVMPLPRSVWSRDCLVKLTPGETRSFVLKVDAELAPNRLLTITMTSGEQKAQLNRVKVAGAGHQPSDGATQNSSIQPSEPT